MKTTTFLGMRVPAHLVTTQKTRKPSEDVHPLYRAEMKREREKDALISELRAALAKAKSASPART